MDARPASEVLAARARALRHARGETLRAVARRSGLSLRLLALVEAGEANPTLSSLVDLARALGADVVDLLRPEPAATRSRPVALVGLRGAGKSTVGRRLADALGWGFVEADRLIEAEAGLSLGALFELHGAAHVRGIEARVLADVVAADDPAVIATGGGVVTAPTTWALLQKRALTVWLKATPQEHWDRVRAQGDERPMAARSAARAELDALWAARAPLYAEAELTIDTSLVDVEGAVAAVRARLQA
ncbi:MAG: helix-turn-helix domain-containing protein [Deltaproteobacteria bacterium]|nr:helix-turn-helix domain-containing protein [Deltaproteobacteria bacterium]